MTQKNLSQSLSQILSQLFFLINQHVTSICDRCDKYKVVRIRKGYVFLKRKNICAPSLADLKCPSRLSHDTVFCCFAGPWAPWNQGGANA